MSQSNRNRGNRNNRNLRKSVSRDRKSLLRMLYNKFDGKCQICGIQTDWNAKQVHKYGLSYEPQYVYGATHPTIEHVVPFFVVQSYAEKYLTLACHQCNKESSYRYNCPPGNCMECAKGLKYPHETQRRYIQYYVNELSIL